MTLLLLLACGLAPPEVATTATLGWGGWFGGPFPQEPVLAGEYLGAFRYDQLKFITTEHTELRVVTGRSTLSLSPDGSAAACFELEQVRAGEIGPLGTPDGQPLSSAVTTNLTLGARGRWAAHGEVIFDVLRQGTCDPDPPQTTLPQPLALACAALVRDGQPLLACTTRYEWLAPAGLDLGTGERVGPWSLRFTEGQGSAPTDVPSGPWLLMAPGAGVTVITSDGRDDRTPRVSVTAGVSQ